MNKGIIFDLDGTLANTAFIHKEAWEIALSKLGISTDIQIETLLGRKTAEIAKILAKDKWKELMSVKNNVYLDLVKRKAKGTSCSKEIIQKAKELGYRTAIVTSSNTISAKEVLNTIGISVDLVITSDDVINGKPDPEGILLAISKLDLNPRLSIGIGDTEVDAIAFKKARLGKIYLVRSEVPINVEKLTSLGIKIVSSLCEIMNELNS
ncbi:HAD family hydrolase [Sulfolobus sp. S-194]|uniref:HAD family hydrolase n=1 Tax=Sulfolobus sp. S-194 TaxID=2512240 RepID=UPI001436DC7D|nr:HAD family hydrolase [Sulfolobus sp. S-194]QIW24852.1 HAD family hydrolase [Sulfolobus sp. S-194]